MGKGHQWFSIGTISDNHLGVSHKWGYWFVMRNPNLKWMRTIGVPLWLRKAPFTIHKPRPIPGVGFYVPFCFTSPYKKGDFSSNLQQIWLVTGDVNKTNPPTIPVGHLEVFLKWGVPQQLDTARWFVEKIPCRSVDINPQPLGSSSGHLQSFPQKNSARPCT